MAAQDSKGWAEEVVRGFSDSRERVGKGSLSQDEFNLLQVWLEERLQGGEPELWLPFTWNDEPTLVLLDDDGIRLVTMDADGTITTDYPAAPYGAQYSERWSYVDERFTLELRFEHETLPGELSIQFVTLKEIDQKHIPWLRSLLRRWAIDSPPSPQDTPE